MTQTSPHFKLNKGDTIGIFAPSSYVDMAKLAHAQTIIEKMGFHVFVHPQTSLRHNQSAGSAQDKAAAFHDLLKDTNIKAIIAARGGNRCSHMLDHIDWRFVKENPKPIFGFSDLTVLLNAIHAKTGLTNYFAPDALFLEKLDSFSLKTLNTFLQEKTIKYNFSGAKIIHEGNITAPVIGGTLTAFQALIGTDYMPNPKGKILLLEDTYEETSRIDRALLQLKRALPFKDLEGIIFGSFTHLQDTGKTPFGFSLENIIREHTEGLNIPIIMNAPFGHSETFYPLPLGAHINFEVEKNTSSITSL